MKRKLQLSFQITVALLILILLAMLITGAMILFRGVGSDQPFTYMIILGNKIEGSEPSPLLTDRINTAAKYMEEHPQVIAIASGFQSKHADISEAQCIYDGLVQRGIDPSRIRIEDQSSSTRENFKNAIALLEEELGRIPHNIGVVSNEFHLLRASMIAQNNGLDPIMIPAPTSDTEAFCKYFVREIFMIWLDGIKVALT